MAAIPCGYRGDEMKRVLIGCEESGTLTTKFREAGFECYSCDTEPTRGNPEWHYQMDVKECIKKHGPWALIILHPPCTSLAVCSNKHYAEGKPDHQQRLDDIDWTIDLWETAKKYAMRVALENPISVIFQYLMNGFFKAPVCYIQPHEHGHGETKKTGLALYNLPPIYPTDEVDGREQRIWKMAPGPNRKRDRSATYPGIADAIVDQWGSLLNTTGE